MYDIKPMALAVATAVSQMAVATPAQKMDVVPQAEVAVPEERWQVVDAETGKVVSVHGGRAAARSAKAEGQRVVDAWKS